MANVIASLTMSVDGFIALPDDSVGPLFDWYESGDEPLAWPGMGMVSHVTPASAGYLRGAIGGTGAIVVGRRVYDYTNGWGGNHPLAVPLFLVTHRPPASWPTPDAPFTAVAEGVAAAIAQASAVAGDKAVALAGPSIIQQALDLGLVDEIAVDLAPVLLGEGIRFFGELAHAPLLLDDPTVVQGTRVTHLRYRVRRLPVRRERRDELRDPAEQAGAVDRVAVVAGVHDEAVADRDDHDEGHRERALVGDPVPLEPVLDHHHLRVGRLMDAHVDRPGVPARGQAGRDPGPELLPRRLRAGRGETARERHLDDELLGVAVGHVPGDRADGRLEEPLDGLPGAAVGHAPSRSRAVIAAGVSATSPAAMFSARWAGSAVPGISSVRP